MHSLRTRLSAVALLAALAGCGGGGGGGGGSAGGDGAAGGEVAVVLGQPGPGDVDNYFPLSVGNFWHFRGTATGAVAGPIDNTISITSTRVVGGVTAFVLREASADSADVAGEQAVVEDANGIAVLVDDGGGAPLDLTIASYWDVRFPLQAGAEFVQLDRSNGDLGIDLDGDQRNETVAVRAVVRVLSFEAVDVPAGSFANAVRIERTVTLSIRLSRDGSSFTGTEVDNTWFARNVGPVRRTRVVDVLDSRSAVDEQLDAYLVGGVAVGIHEGGVGGVAAGAVNAGESVFWAFRNVPAGRQVAALAGLTADADLAVLSGGSCIGGAGTRTGTDPEDCRFDSGGGTVVLRVKGVQAARYVVALAPAPAIAAPASEFRTIAAGILAGQVAARGESRYAVTGLAPGAYTIAIAGLSDDADLRVVFDETYSMEQECTLRGVGDVLAQPEDCTTASGGALWFSVRSGELNTVGASYLILVSPAP